MGPPGSGKSTLARHLGTHRGLPVFHLDQAYWQPNWMRTPEDIFSAEVERIAALPAWVIDGNYLGTINPRLRAADTLIYIDASIPLCMLRIIRRIVFGYGRIRSDAAPGCPERLDLAFLRFAWNWNRRRRATHLALVQGFGGRKLVFQGGRALRRFLESDVRSSS